MITVYIVSHNYGKFLRQAIESVICQCGVQWELILINDGSTDETGELCEEYSKKYEQIQCLHHDERAGLQKCANKALAIARGEFFIRLDADDWFHELALACLRAKFARRDDLGLVYPSYFYVNADGCVIGQQNLVSSKSPELNQVPAHGACSLIRTRALKSIGGYDESVSAQDGWDIWFRLKNKYRLDCVDLPLFYYRQHENSVSKDQKQILQARRNIMSRQKDVVGGYRAKVLALIPVKQSYRNWENACFSAVGDTCLLQRALKVASESEWVSSICVSSESDEVLKYCRDLSDRQEVDRHLQFLRPSNPDQKELIQPTGVPLQKLMVDALQYATAKGCEADLVVCLNLHTPFRTATHIDHIVDVLLTNPFDIVVSTTEIVDPIFSYDGHNIRTLNPGRFANLEMERERLFAFSGIALGCWKDYLTASHDMFSGNLGQIVADKVESFQIKGDLDLQIANFLANE